MRKNSGIVTVPLWDRIKIHFFTFIYGFWMLCKMAAKWVWNPKTFLILQQRDNPPTCLVDSSLGQHKYVKLKGIKYHYVESGPSDAPLILLLHGFPDCWLSWRHQIPVLSQYFRVVALDLKGFGDSDKPSSRKTYRINMLLEELRHFIKSLEVSRCIIIGHDIGALLGWYFANQFPSFVQKLVVVSCPHPNVFKSFVQTSSHFQWISFVQLPYFPEVHALRDDIKILSKFHQHLTTSDTYLEAYKYAFCRKEDWTGALNYHRNLLFVEIAENTSAIQVPVILITGDRDYLVKLESIIKSTYYCEKFHVKIVDGAKHFPHQEHPKQFNDILLKYLVKSVSEKNLDRSGSKGIMNRMFGAVSTTVKYGNSMLDSVHKKTNEMVQIPNINLLKYTNIYNQSDT